MSEHILFAAQMPDDGPGEPQEDSMAESAKFLVFTTDDLRIGVEAEYVEEIITDYVITDLPRVPDFIRGIVNLRGRIIPILDVRLRLGKPENDDCIVIVLNIEETAVGILVDSVSQMIDVLKKNILPMPLQSDQQLVSGMCTLPDQTGTMLLLDCGQLLAHG